MIRWLTALAVASASGAAGAAEVVESRFETEFIRGGETYTTDDRLVPNLPDAACYHWYLKFDPATKTEVTLVERLTLPEPLAAWTDYVNDPASTTQVNADAMGAVTRVVQTPDEDGWVTHGWCVAEGDPNGQHNITVTLDGVEVGNWDFAVLAEADYPFTADGQMGSPAAAPNPPAPPAPPPQPSPLARDVNRSW